MSKQEATGKSRFSPALLTGLILFLLFAASLCLRVCLPYEQIFTGEWVKFIGADAYYHMHLVDNLMYNFPHLIDFDPYLAYPRGEFLAGPPLFDWLLVGIIWVVGLGSPSPHLVDVVGAYFPAVLGALLVFPVYFIGRELFGRVAGLFSAALIAFIPGEFLGRSLLGFTDHHAAEVLFTTVTILFLMLAVKSASQRGLTFQHVRHRDWAVVARPIIYSLLAGISLGIYLLTWSGGLLFVFIFSAYFVIQFTIDHLRGRPTDYLCVVGVILFAVAAVMFLPIACDVTNLWPFSYNMVNLVSLVGVVFIPLVLSGVSRLLTWRRLKRGYYPLALFAMVGFALAILYAISPTLFTTLVEQFGIFFPTATSMTVLEMQPLLFPHGEFSLAVAWGNFTTGAILSLVALLVLIYLIIKRGGGEKILLVVWSLMMLAAMLGQRRFAYYFAVNAALLSGCLAWLTFELARYLTSRFWKTEATEGGGDEEKPETRRNFFYIKPSRLGMALVSLLVFFTVFFPNVKPAIMTAQQLHYVPEDGWFSSLVWLKDNTPDPFGDATFYYQPYGQPEECEQLTGLPVGITDQIARIRLKAAKYSYPASAYGVMAWWDYGYWIVRVGHRPVNTYPAKPIMNTNLAAHFFVAQGEAAAREIVEGLDSRYVVIDYSTATGKFWAMAAWAGKEPAQFFDIYYVPLGDGLMPVLLFHEEYYYAMSTRLYNFDGEEVTPQYALVISYEEKENEEGELIKEVIDTKQFTSYEEATDYIASQGSGNYRIVSPDPFISPVPLAALGHYQLVYSSEEPARYTDDGVVPLVKIFEYVE